MSKPVPTSKAKKKTGPAKSKTREASQEKTIKDQEEINDFGGLPQRDLKKNLGCG
jgi:hypothetical protein